MLEIILSKYSSMIVRKPTKFGKSLKLHHVSVSSKVYNLMGTTLLYYNLTPSCVMVKNDTFVY